MKPRSKRIVILLLLASLWGCAGPSAPAAPATGEELSQLKIRMTRAFGALEMYAADNSLTYPQSLKDLMPKYLDVAPLDPVSRQAIFYEKTEDGFLLGASGDYSKLDADPGFPKMNQDGFFVKKESEFPKDE